MKLLAGVGPRRHRSVGAVNRQRWAVGAVGDRPRAGTVWPELYPLMERSRGRCAWRGKQKDQDRQQAEWVHRGAFCQSLPLNVTAEIRGVAATFTSRLGPQAGHLSRHSAGRDGRARPTAVRFKFVRGAGSFSSSWPGSSRPSMSLLATLKTWMAATRAAMTGFDDRPALNRLSGGLRIVGHPRPWRFLNVRGAIGEPLWTFLVSAPT